MICYSFRKSILLTALFAAGALLRAEEPSSVRNIHLRMDDAQIHFTTRIFELRNASAEELLPFVNSAIKRYNRNSTIRRVTTRKSPNGALQVSTGIDFMPYVEKIVAVLDRKGAEGSGAAPSITGTGLTRVAYTPNYRAAAQFAQLIDSTIGSSSSTAYVNQENNTIFWRDQSAAAARTLHFVKQLDRPIPQAELRFNYYELRDSDLKDWGFDYLAWKNGPGVNLLNVGYNTGELVINELLEQVPYIASATWGFGGFFTAPQFDMSFIRCLQQSGNASSAANASLVMTNTPVSTVEEFALLCQYQDDQPDTAPFIYRISMQPEYQNIAKNGLGRTFIGKSFYEDEYGEKHSDPPSLESKIVNPFICLPAGKSDQDAHGFLPATQKYYEASKKLKDSGGVIFDYGFYFKSVVERGNTGSELNNTALFSGAATLAFGEEKVLAIYEKENDVEQTIGLPVLCRIPLLKYLFSTVTTIKERTYIIVTAEATLIHPHSTGGYDMPRSSTTEIDRRIEDPFRINSQEEKKNDKH